jgi:competence protein ComEA
MVSLSTATEKELEELPGVGPATAAAIVAHRRVHGPFRRVEDLLEVKGIGETKLAAMRSRIVP